jgi:hypothetical protein
MPFYHVVAILAGGTPKVVTNRSEADVLTNFVIPFVSTGTVTTNWGSGEKTRQAFELRVYCTDTPHTRSAGETFEQHIKGRKNRYGTFEQKAKRVLGKRRNRVFVVMPIQGEKYGLMEQQRIFDAYNDRFAAIEKVLDGLECVAIRIDKEAPLGGLVERIKDEIRRAQFVIADLTDERQSCYYELGYADALKTPAICIASKDSVLKPGTPTKIHFDIHRPVHFFTNHTELREKIKQAFEKNRATLLTVRDQTDAPTLNI